ncbi:PP2C-like domain-containing protein CG9801 [Dysidea avara]|uniref:PP2C-like domain-containing protein CG9801 n=1 Tax=Dysidea avara TaxID=196820 RepID=UPI00331E91D5
MAESGGAVANKWYSRVSHAISSVASKITKPDNAVFPDHICDGKYAHDMPKIPVAPLGCNLWSASTGPNAGMCQLDPLLDTFPDDGQPIAGIVNWRNGKQFADGASASLYDKIPGKNKHSGDPIADVFAVVVHDNSSILAIADGVNWGHKPRLAARCAIHGALSHIINKFFSSKSDGPRTTHDIFHTLLRSFQFAQESILKHEGTTTTLCIAIVCELMPPKGPTRWGCCLVSVGDSLAYVYRRRLNVVEELTSVIHVGSERDMRDCGGCLGPHIGTEPDLENLFLIFAPVEESDIIFLTTDGVSDNFDPVVRKEAQSMKSMHQVPYDSDPDTPTDNATPYSLGKDHVEPLPFLTPSERHAHSLKHMTNVIHTYSHNDISLITAANVAVDLITSCVTATDQQRLYLEENVLSDDCTPEERRQNYRQVKKALKNLPGKLDHATAVAYEVCHRGNGISAIQWQSRKQTFTKAYSADQSFQRLPPYDDEEWTELEKLRSSTAESI